MEISPSDLPGQVWIKGDSTFTTFNGNTTSAIGAGKENTESIISQTGQTES